MLIQAVDKEQGGGADNGSGARESAGLGSRAALRAGGQRGWGLAAGQPREPHCRRCQSWGDGRDTGAEEVTV